MATKKYESVEHYVNLPWTYQVTTQQDNVEGELYIVCVNELPGVCTDAKTVDEAMVLIKDAIEGVIESMIEHNKEIPTPPNEETLRVIKDIEEGKDLVRAKDAEDLFKKLGT